MKRPVIDQFIAEQTGIIPNLHASVSQGGLYRQYERYCEKRGVDPEPYDTVAGVLAMHIIGLQTHWSETVSETLLTGIHRFVSRDLEVACAS